MAIKNPIIAGKEKEMLSTVKAGDLVWIGSKMQSVTRTTRGKIFIASGRIRPKEYRIRRDTGISENGSYWAARISGLVDPSELVEEKERKARAATAELTLKELQQLFSDLENYGHMNVRDAGALPQRFNLTLRNISEQRMKNLAFYLKMVGEEQE